MRIISLCLISLFLVSNAYAKTLVKYYKNTGDIIQTNTVDRMPDDNILYERFKTENTDVLLVDGSVDILTQRVDLDKKSIVNIPQEELDRNREAIEKRQAEEKLIQDKIREQVLEALKAEGKIK